MNRIVMTYLIGAFSLFSLTSCSLFMPDRGVTETYTFVSASIGEISTVIVYLPQDYASDSPIIYLLNGWGTEANAWGSGIDLELEAEDRQIIFVSLSAGSHTYTNSSTQSTSNYEDYVLEVVSKVEKKYDLQVDYQSRALCGISNGGGGAIFILSEHPDQFIASGSLSGTYYSSLSNYANFSGRAIRIDVGTEDDDVLTQLRWLHNKLDSEGVDHEYYEHPGGHNWTFWKKYCPKQFDWLQDQLEGS